MKPSTTYKPNQSFGLLLQGATGMGKTTFALQFPRPYIFDADNNLSGAFRRLNEKKITFSYDIGLIDDEGKEVPLSPTSQYVKGGSLIRTADHTNSRYWRMIKCLTEAALSPDIDTIILDTASTISDYIMAECMRLLPTVTGNMEIPSWGVYLDAWKKLIIKIRSQQKAVVLIVHERVEKDEHFGTITYEVMLPGQISTIMGSLFSDIWHMEINDTGERIVRTQPTRQLKLKCSLDLPTTFLASDFTKVTTAMQKGIV